jgi:hypothetical protein
MKSLIIIVIGLYVSWHYTDLESENIIFSGLAPFGVVIFLISLCLWLVLKAGFGARTTPTDGSGSTFFDGGDGGD